MSPPLAGTEKQKAAKTKVRRKKTMTLAQLKANRANARLSRGPVSPEGKARSRLNACQHNLRAELPILPGENSDELNRRLAVWPGLLGAEGEIEEAVATRAVHTFWRLERADLSEDAAAEQVMLAIDQEVEERDAEEVRQLEAQIDGYDDSQGVVRKLKRSPAGCRLLIQEFRGLRDRMIIYDTLFWSQRTRLFHLLGKREGDLFTDDPVITQWMVALLGTAFGDDPDKLAKVSETLDGLRPVWMGDIEYGQRMQFFVAALPGRDRGEAMVLNLVAAALADLNERLVLAEASARHERALAFKAARVDDSPAGARRLSYKMRHDGAFHAALRRLDAMKKMRWAGLAADEEDATAAPGAAATEPSPVVASDPVTAVPNDPITTVPNDPITAVPNDPITAVPNDPIATEATDPIAVVTADPVSAETSEPIPIGRGVEAGPCERGPGPPENGMPGIGVPPSHPVVAPT